ncbi:hypothetical protein [Pseudoalteromonas luteoviolacea]|uniref:Uncharacterized protein n=1 Tax=Pseudoalteromonas luteoviolacea S4054 TaxID=1129367 RepID=A0A0F6AFF8_9GAMM|nr:hypothetical protein [Pseudoalteromonas luteoviolacea]AOT10025.1 hypothetical protein S4054249_20380 [Pseudoalteromonas luteoviolacea]AOT14936.1 hypothetical protein S40542_20350 [Pseudoalteromonas luteoviolacea]AOT19852.1 hypothetical protein S4054_20355 [Pseudoalteromonas luteoviolacea]KKE84893.1 hypothetical protein N479_07285 [Pseudoalteromonas luteoviolacea S4054]KZN72510.1 hypothetical protein N481_14875 [Pseudoalteromonas luteoviolacea S4047-1]
MNAFKLTLASLLVISGCSSTEAGSDTSQSQQAQPQVAEQPVKQNKKQLAPAQLQTKSAVRHDTGHGKPAPAKMITKAEPIAHYNEDEISQAGIQNQHKYLNFITKDKSCDSNSQCLAIPVGSRACGGPSSYLLFSTKTADQNKVYELAKKLTDSEAQYNAKHGMISICEHLRQPTTQCVENTCVTLGGTNKSPTRDYR